MAHHGTLHGVLHMAHHGPTMALHGPSMAPFNNDRPRLYILADVRGQFVYATTEARLTRQSQTARRFWQRTPGYTRSRQLQAAGVPRRPHPCLSTLIHMHSYRHAGRSIGPSPAVYETFLCKTAFPQFLTLNIAAAMVRHERRVATAHPRLTHKVKATAGNDETTGAPG